MYLGAAFPFDNRAFEAARERAAALKVDDNTLMASWWRAPSLSHHDWMIAEIARGRLRVQCQIGRAGNRRGECGSKARVVLDNDYSYQ